MAIDLVYFDIGNIFMTYDKVFTRVIADFNLDRQQLEDIYEPFDIDANLGRINIPDIWPVLCQKLNIRGGENYNFIRSWVSDYESIKPMHQLVRELSQKYRLGILSNYYRYFFDECLRQNFIPDVKFDPVIISAEVGLMKPDPAIFDLAAARAGVSPDRIFFIDDKSENIDQAARHGWQTFLFDYRHPDAASAELRTRLL